MPALNIKNEEAYRLVKELAELEGESMTYVVIEAVRDRLGRKRQPERDDERIQYWLNIGRELRADADPEWLAMDHGDLLYDEVGLPK